MSGFDDWEQQGPPEIHPVPENRRRSSTTMIIVGVAAAVLLITIAVAVAVSRTVAPPARHGSGSRGSSTVTESFVVTGPSGADTSTVVTEVPTSGPPPDAQSATGTPDALAYRVGNEIWVADETGAHSRKVATGRAGMFSLSPDGAMLAVADAVAKRLVLIDTSSSRVTTVATTDVYPSAPVWAPSSAWLAFVTSRGGKSQVHRVSRFGGEDVTVGDGDRPAIGPDSATYAYVSTLGRLMVAPKGQTPRPVSVSGRVDEVALTDDRVVYALGGQQRSDLSIHSALLTGADDRPLVGAPVEANAGRYARLLPAPKGTWLAYTAIGDDGFSSLKTVRLDGSSETSLSRRSSDYPLRWSADASKLFFIEGNAAQGQKTALLFARPDGTQRTKVVTSAGL